MSESTARRDARVLVVDDDRAFAETLASGLKRLGWQARATGEVGTALTMIREREFDAVVTDLRMPDIDGLSVLETAKQFAPERPVIIMTAFGSIDSAIELVRAGATYDI